MNRRAILLRLLKKAALAFFNFAMPEQSSSIVHGCRAPVRIRRAILACAACFQQAVPAALLGLAVLLSAHNAPAQEPAGSKARPRHAELAEPVAWDEAGRTRLTWPAPRELAVTRRPGAAHAGERPAGRMTGRMAGAHEIGARGRTTFLRLDEPLDRWSFWSRTLPLAADSDVETVSPVYYSGPSKDPLGRMVLTGRIVVGWGDMGPEEVADLEKTHGLSRLETFPGNTAIYDTGGTGGMSDPRLSLDTAALLARDGRTAFAYPDWQLAMATRAVPDDPLFPRQWHLTDSRGLQGLPSVWDDFRGSRRQVVAIVDDGLDSAHPDFVGNFMLTLSWDFVDNDNNPAHGLFDEGHGTACAGVAAARGFNGLGVCGASPWAGLAGIRLLGNISSSTAAAALTWRGQNISVYTNSWGPPDDGATLVGPDPLMALALASGTGTGRGGLGSIYVWAAGNGRLRHDNANYDGFANSRRTIAVAATDSEGRQAPYSEPGACILVNAPSGTPGLGITTTDRGGSNGYASGAYTSTFGGTSAASPLVAGVVALALQANPRLTWRDVQHVLALSADKNDPQDPSWFANGAGRLVSHAYGFGRVNAQAAVTLARAWRTLPPERAATARRRVDTAIPDNDPLGVISRIDIAEDLQVEFVEVAFSAADHPFWSDLRVELTSPSGATSVLAESRPGSASGSRYDGWIFGSVLHLGESSRGAWSLRVSDRLARDTGTFQSWALTIHGTRPAAPRHNPAAMAGPLALLLRRAG